MKLPTADGLKKGMRVGLDEKGMIMIAAVLQREVPGGCLYGMWVGYILISLATFSTNIRRVIYSGFCGCVCVCGGEGGDL
jgi:hypothetical protein